MVFIRSGSFYTFYNETIYYMHTNWYEPSDYMDISFRAMLIIY